MAASSESIAAVAQPPEESILDRARRKAFYRLLPLCFLCYVIAYVDRANVSLAKLTMVRDLKGFDDAVFGMGSGVFFIGYFLLEIPGTLLVEKWSARKWISRIMLTWGVMAGVTALVKTPFQFYSVRFLLGLAEAGFFPGSSCISRTGSPAAIGHAHWRRSWWRLPPHRSSAPRFRICSCTSGPPRRSMESPSPTRK